MKKIYLFAVVTLMLAACNSEEPISNQLIGTWSEPYHVSTYVKSFTFDEDGLLDYKRVVDTTWFIVIAEAGEFAKMNYKVKKNKLHFSGTGKKFNDNINKYENASFEFITDYSITGDTLTIDSFSCDGGLLSRFYYNIKLSKL